ncbi:hypothetical protein A2U01_0095343, partial [Trifolium medium]|nr:hypothetical protein [Trifolium medium]
MANVICGFKGSSDYDTGDHKKVVDL